MTLLMIRRPVSPGQGARRRSGPARGRHLVPRALPGRLNNGHQKRLLRGLHGGGYRRRGPGWRGRRVTRAPGGTRAPPAPLRLPPPAAEFAQEPLSHVP
jgi:hypothetical protein